jgi:hypothetical protein
MQGLIDALRDTTDRLENAGIEYYLVGSLAAMQYGRPRFTNDIDLVAQIQSSQVGAFEKHFDTEEYYCPPREVIADEVIRGGMFNLIHQASGVKIDIVPLKKTEFAASEFSRRKKVDILPGLSVYVASVEDIILKKLDYYREGGSEKHLTDIRGILAETEINRDYIKNWVGKLGLQAEWEKIG